MGKKFARTSDNVRGWMAELSRGSMWVVVTGRISGVCRDPKDDFILECAVLGKADLIVTGDNDLLSLGSYGDIDILTPRQYLDRSTR
jgi:putative PIN family toxin of toxin-antitoxin system